MTFLMRPQWGNVALIFVCACVIVAPHLIQGFPLPKSEDFEYTTVPSIIWAREVFSGHPQGWFWTIGLGTPWPIPLGLGHSPLGFLLAFTKPLTATAIIVWTHLVLMGLSVLWLCGRFNIAPLLRPACLLSAMLGPHLEYLYPSDAPTVLLGSLWLPVIFAFVVSILDGGTLRARFFKAVGLGIASGILLREGHVGVTATYALAFAIYLAFNWRHLLIASPFFLLALVIGVVIAIPQLLTILTEFRLFPKDTPRLHDGLRDGATRVLWGLFVRPFSLNFTQSNMLVRTISFGGVFAIIVLMFARGLLQGKGARPMLLTLCICVLLLFVPERMMPAAFSAIWPVRDLANLFGVLLAGVALTAFVRSSKLKQQLAIAQTALVIAAAIPLLAGGIILKHRGIFTTAQYNALVDVNNPTPYIKALQSAIGEEEGVNARFVATSRASQMMDQEALVDQGAVNNVAITHGLAEVSYIAKGVSYDTIQRSQSKPYGAIAGDLYRGFVFTPGDYDWPRDNQALLSLLGIKAVVAEASEMPKAPGLHLVAVLKGRDGFSASIYRNDRSLPPAFFTPAAVLDQRSMNRGGCNRDVLVCRDVSNVVEAAEYKSIVVESGPDRISISFAPSQTERTLLVTALYRAGWVTRDDDGRELPITSWNGIWRIEVPAGTGRISATYRQNNR